MAELTPTQWLELLDKRLTDRWSRMRRLQDYYDGHHRMAFATSKYREEFATLLGNLSDNWCQVVVSASVERLAVQGFRFGTEQQADTDAWGIWQANGLDAESNMAHTEAVKLGEAYWLVAPPGPDGVPRITAEHPSQVIVATAVADRRERVAALKKWVDDDGYVYATVYLPEMLHKFRSEKKHRDSNGRLQWRQRPGDPGGHNPLGVVPVIPIRNNPSLLGGGQSDLEPALPLQDAIDKLAADMMVAAEFAAYRQRVMTGVEAPEYPEGHAKAGQPMPVELGVNRLFTVGDPDARVFDLQASELGNYTNAIEMLVQHLAAQTKTPPHYLLGKMLNVSGDALVTAEAGLQSKVDDKKLAFGDAHEDTVRLAFLALGDERRAAAMDAETLWADSERRSFAQVVDGTVKLKELGLPDELLWEELGKSPQWIARAKAMQATMELFASTEPAPVPPADDEGEEVAA